MGAPTMEKIRVVQILKRSAARSVFKGALVFSLGLLLASCSAKFLKHDKEDQLKQIDEFDNKVKIVIPEETPAQGTSVPLSSGPMGASPQTASEKSGSDEKSSSGKASSKDGKTEDKKISAKDKQKASKAEAGKKGKKGSGGKSLRRQPEIESDLGFDGRRPIKDPFRVGEKVVHAVDYYKVSAGTMTLEVKPFAQVNGNKSYHFEMTAKTSNWYSGIYKVEDRATILMDYDTLVPSVYTLHVKETSQLKEARMLFENGKATYWEKKVTEKSGVEERKQNWDIEEYTQSLYSAVFYTRFFTWEVGKEIAFRVADDNENMIFKAQAIRKEKISTKAGDFNAVVIKPQVELKGKFKQAGDIFMWLSDDDRRYILRIEAKIKIGSLVSEIIELQPGAP